jgi:hypothetical protein
MGNFNLKVLENEAYSFTVKLFSFYKTLKENNITIADSNEVLKAAAEISTFVLEINEKPCKAVQAANELQAKALWCSEKIQAYSLSERYSSAKADLLLQLNNIQKQFNLLLN